ncbi:MAG: DUF3540 domain-containing protein [Myxococcales bacterium]|nr:DUF3540 domain-containing protein [Myxococcales bacterium]
MKEQTMKNLATKLEAETVFQSMGPVIRVEGDVFVVQTDRGELRSRRAVSCLVAPELHDFVLVACQNKEAYVLAVLERESPHTTLVSEGDMNLQTRAGKVRLTAAEGVDVVTPKALNLVSQELAMHAHTAKLMLEDVVALGTRVVAELAETRLRGNVLDKVFERVSERVKRSFRRVEEIDQLKAKQLDYLTEETMSLRSENMVATAKDLVKVDGEQIHFG